MPRAPALSHKLRASSRVITDYSDTFDREQDYCVKAEFVPNIVNGSVAINNVSFKEFKMYETELGSIDGVVIQLVNGDQFYGKDAYPCLYHAFYHRISLTNLTFEECDVGDIKGGRLVSINPW